MTPESCLSVMLSFARSVFSSIQGVRSLSGMSATVVRNPAEYKRVPQVSACRCDFCDRSEWFQLLDFRKIPHHACCVTSDHGAFGDYLAARIHDSGLSQRRVAERAGVDEGTIRAYLRGYVVRRGAQIVTPPTVPTVIRIADALEVDRAEMLAAAGLDAPRHLLERQPPSGEPGNDELIELLRRRLEGPTQGRLPVVELTDPQIRWRGRLIVRLETVADEAREIGDESAAEALCGIADALNAQLEAAMAAEISEAQNRHPQPGK